MNARSWIYALAVLLMAVTNPAVAQLFSSSDTMKIVVPFAAGGVVDQIARSIANEAGAALKASVIIENRAGAGGEVGASAVAKAPGDGRTILMGTFGTHILNPILRSKSVEAAAAFAPIVRIGTVKNVLIVRGDLPARSFKELIEFAKAGGRLTYGSAGQGTTLHIAAEMINDAAGIKAAHVPYRGAEPALTDLVNGHIDFVVTSVIGVLPHIQDGRVRPLATFDAERAEQLPDLPTTVELGFQDLTLSNWFGLFVPASTPAESRRELEAVLVAVVRSAKIQGQLVNAGVTGVKGAEAFAMDINDEFKKWPPILRRLGIGE